MANFARIRFEDEPTKFLTKPITDILSNKDDDEKDHIQPSHMKDFDPKKFYFCKWSCKETCTEDHEHYDFYKCRIMFLGESEEDINNKLLKRHSIQNLKMDLGATENEKITFKELSTSTIDKGKLALKKIAVVKNRSATVLRNHAQKRLSVIKDSASEGSDDDETHKKLKMENQSVQNEAQKKSEQNSKRSKTTEAPLQSQKDGSPSQHSFSRTGYTNDSDNDEISPHVTRRKRFLSSNRNASGQHNDDIYNANLANLHDQEENDEEHGHKHTKQWIENLIVEATDYYSANGEGSDEYKKRYTLTDNGETYLGEGVSMKTMNWNLLVSEGKPSTFARLLACKIWSPYHLANRAVSVRRIQNRNALPNRSPIKELERNKLRLLISLFWDYLEGKKKLPIADKMIYLRKTTSYLSRKIRDLRDEIGKQHTAAARRLHFDEN